MSVIRPQDVCRKVAIYLGWKGDGDYYEWINSLVDKGETAQSGNALIEKVAALLGWEEEDGKAETYVSKNIDQAFSYFRDIDIEVGNLRKDKINLQVDLDHLQNDLKLSQEKLQDKTEQVNQLVLENDALKLEIEKLKMPASSATPVSDPPSS